MIKWLDSFGREWGVTYNLSHNGKYVDRTTYPPRGNHGETVQMTIEAFKELRLAICELRVE
jgi:hypothetical protein